MMVHWLTSYLMVVNILDPTLILFFASLERGFGGRINILKYLQKCWLFTRCQDYLHLLRMQTQILAAIDSQVIR